MRRPRAGDQRDQLLGPERRLAQERLGDGGVILGGRDQQVGRRVGMIEETGNERAPRRLGDGLAQPPPESEQMGAFVRRQVIRKQPLGQLLEDSPVLTRPGHACGRPFVPPHANSFADACHHRRPAGLGRPRERRPLSGCTTACAPSGRHLPPGGRLWHPMSVPIVVSVFSRGRLLLRFRSRPHPLACYLLRLRAQGNAGEALWATWQHRDDSL